MRTLQTILKNKIIFFQTKDTKMSFLVEHHWREMDIIRYYLLLHSRRWKLCNPKIIAWLYKSCICFYRLLKVNGISYPPRMTKKGRFGFFMASSKKESSLISSNPAALIGSVHITKELKWKQKLIHILIFHLIFNKMNSVSRVNKTEINENI